ncbi:large subunit ribosomal protein L6 [Dehalogenimonas formicexedens]|uniref:Large ribosomal subunit protein uL6 n=1 Tax=Dehalogenimonas formicexedens TaxID=1839801 RepID=A0A1P8F563_9CHLR|nr:50S ribosomal protein L6 [Dehalogenimonas formicexedens]APV43570.1 large subunit ribosomal protein L6 [Dehalogenimonas formicexedens]
MSRIGKIPVAVPKGVKVTIDGDTVTVTGPKGELKRTFSPEMGITQEDGKLVVTRPSDAQQHKALHGLSRTLLSNMVKGVSEGYEKGLEIVGVGFRAEKAGETLVLRVGYSHTVEVAPEKGISFTLESPTKLKVVGIDKEQVGQVAAEIRAVKKPDAYKGKGIRYAGEKIKLKPGKAVGKAAK